MADEGKKPKAEEKGSGFKSKDDKAAKQQPQQQQRRAIQIVRVAETDLDGGKPVRIGVKKVKGVSHMFANAIGKVYPMADKKIVDLSEAEIRDLEDVIFNPAKYGIPVWMFNRRHDPDTAENRHLAVSHLQLAQTTDINKMKKMKSYKGVRHGLGLPVRGQRTRSSFREKGKTIGVRKVKEQPAKGGAAPAKK